MILLFIISVEYIYDTKAEQKEQIRDR